MRIDCEIDFHTCSKNVEIFAISQTIWQRVTEMQLQHCPEMFRFRLALQVGFVMMIVIDYPKRPINRSGYFVNSKDR
jgi:hypothetical protein